MVYEHASINVKISNTGYCQEVTNLIMFQAGISIGCCDFKNITCWQLCQMRK